MDLNQLRAYINEHFAPNGVGGIDATEAQTALLALVERIEANASWMPFFGLVSNGPFLVMKIVDWRGGQGVKPQKDVYLGPNGEYVGDIHMAVNLRGATGPQGVSSISTYMNITQPADGLGPTRWYPVAELPTPTGGTYDYINFELIAKGWDNSAGAVYRVDMFLSNRGGNAYYEYDTQGKFGIPVGIVAYRLPDFRMMIYAKSDSNFNVVMIRIKSHAQATLLNSGSLLVGTSTAPTGDLVVDTTTPQLYPPMTASKRSFSSIFSGNSDGSYPDLNLNQPGSAMLSIGANWTGGRSELDFISNNIASSGFGFWQRTGAASKALLAYLSGNGDFCLGGGTPIEMFTNYGNAYIGGYVKFSTTTAKRRIVLYEGSPNDHQFYGFGVTSGTLNYQVNSTGDKHVFYAGSSPATSKTLAAITGDGRLGVGTDTPSYPIDVYASNPTNGILAQFVNSASASQNGALLQIHQGGVAVWQIGQPAGVSAFVINGWNNGAFPEYLRIDSTGALLFGGRSKAGWPVLADIPTNKLVAYKNTSTGERRLYWNDNGTLCFATFAT